MSIKKSLIDEVPISFMPSLVKAVGLNIAVLLQAIHIELERRGEERDGVKYVGLSYADMRKLLRDSCSLSTVRRMVNEAIKSGYLIKAEGGLGSKNDFSINYDKEARVVRKKAVKPHDKDKSTEWFSTLKTAFLAYYKETTGMPYSFSAKDAGNMSQLVQKIRFVSNELNLDIDMATFFNTYLAANFSEWERNHLSVAIVNSKFNQIIGRKRRDDEELDVTGVI